MDAQNVIEEWEVSPFEGGFDGIRDLQSRRFSGAVEAGGSWLFLRDGDPVAVVADLEVDPRPGDVDAFEGAGGRTHETTHPAAASLAAMLALDGEVRGQYFTEDTPLSRVHETLSEGGFTGYVELSENVLSGDYYVVYEDGDEDYLGVLGSSQRLISDDEAQSKAEGEVGIYSVVAVAPPDVEIPASEPSSAGAAGASGTGGEADEDATDEPAPGDDAPDAPAGDEPTGETASGAALELDEEPAEEADAAATSDAAPEPVAEADTGSDEAGEGGIEIDPAADDDPGEGAGGASVAEQSTSDPEPASDYGGSPEANADVESGPGDPSGPAGDPEPAGSRDPGGADASSAPDRSESDGSGGSGGSGDSVLEGVTTRSVPSLDPERTGRAESSRPTTAGQGSDSGEPAREEPATAPDHQPEPARREPEPEPDRGRSQADDDRLEAVREEYEARIEELESELASLRRERDRLQERVSQLEAEGATADGAAGAGGGGRSLSPAEALAGTSLFVREGTRGEATLEDAHAGRTDRETLEKNLRIEYHTQFEDGEATVDGQPYESWLRASAPYDFVEWLIQDLLFEIQSTGASSALRPLYDAIPRIDRIGFDDPIAVGEGEEAREVTFDVVARNQMGEPLIAATIDEGREPTRAESLQPLIGDAEDVALEHDTLAATFSVTSSYFEPDALDAAREATSGSLLGRDRYRSYVKLARKQGFHLCLVESREESFHLAVPEL